MDNIFNKGDTVYNPKGNIVVLSERVSEGGEGTIYLTDQPNLVAKIYHPDRLTQERYEKLSLMISMRINIQGVCWPKDMLFNNNKEFIGFIMQKARGEEMATTVFKPGKKGLRHMGDWTRVDIVDLTLCICHIFNKLHSYEILVGDVNARNILIYSTEEVYFVDVDSFQIDKYPCAVGTEIFTAPEIFEKHKISGKPIDYSAFLRTKASEQYALASLIFQILMPGKSPFVQQGDDDIADSILQHRFGFPFKEHKGEDAPGGKWRYIWSHMPYALKEQFYNVFALDIRYSAEEWMHVLTGYKNDLERGYVNNEIFPNTFKEVIGEFVSLICEECGVKFNMDEEHYNKRVSGGRAQKVLCKVCVDAIKHNNNIIIPVNCSTCKKSFSIDRQRAATQLERGRGLLCTACDNRIHNRNTSTTDSSKTIIAEDLLKNNPWKYATNEVVAFAMEKSILDKEKNNKV
ncbi:hypothetical protein MASR2M70_12900 [Bacillota bacterium]